MEIKILKQHDLHHTKIKDLAINLRKYGLEQSAKNYETPKKEIKKRPNKWKEILSSWLEDLMVYQSTPNWPTYQCNLIKIQYIL